MPEDGRASSPSLLEGLGVFLGPQTIQFHAMLVRMDETTRALPPDESGTPDLVHFAPVPLPGQPLKSMCDDAGLESQLHTITTDPNNATCPACLELASIEMQKPKPPPDPWMDTLAPVHRRLADVAAAMRQGESAVHHPNHYGGKGPLEVIRVVEHYKLDFNLATAVCYLLRAGRKGPAAVDLKKAVWYLVREIAVEMDEDPSAWVELIPEEFK